MLEIVKNRYTNIIIGFLIFLVCLGILLFAPKNFWIDMTGWTQWEYTYEWSINLSLINDDLESIKRSFDETHNNILNAISAYEVTWEKKIVVEVWYISWNLTETELDKTQQDFNALIISTLEWQNETFELSKYTNIWQSFWDYIKNTAIITLLLCLVGIATYVWFAFWWVAEGIPAQSFAIVVLITQMLDVVVASGLYITVGFFFKELQVDTFFITALLTILWFSINNTIVVFDRVRENTKTHIWDKKNTKKLRDFIDISVAETIKRSFYTSFTLLLVLVAIFILGPELLRWFMMTMAFWVIFGFFSSLYIAPGMLFELNKNTELKVIEKKKLTDDDKIVV